SPIANTEDLFGERNVVYKVSINKLEDINDYDLITDELIDKIIKKRRKKLYGDENYQAGDFRSVECVELLKQADIVVTNPPFSLFREYVAQLIEYDKKFLIIGNKNSISYKEVFTYIKQNKIWLGFNSACEFFTIENGQKVKTKKVQGLTRWLTNLEHKKRHEELDLYKKYNPQEFPKYDNYDAINVDKTADIPYDYYEPMGVPITFLDKYSPEQFEILGQMANTKVDEHNFGYPFINGERKYARILIKRIKNEN
ncbi:MAG: adenine-specific methyltransferase EcoRI family protein, partial [Campylobacter sp.]|nr:adenine-specific methyltransferase EcoRI family protein [Campylobacter sp.]